MQWVTKGTIGWAFAFGIYSLVQTPDPVTGGYAAGVFVGSFATICILKWSFFATRDVLTMAGKKVGLLDAN